MIIENITYECSRCGFETTIRYEIDKHMKSNPICLKSDLDGLTEKEALVHDEYLRSKYGDNLENYNGTF